MQETKVYEIGGMKVRTAREIDQIIAGLSVFQDGSWINVTKGDTVVYAIGMGDIDIIDARGDMIIHHDGSGVIDISSGKVASAILINSGSGSINMHIPCSDTLMRLRGKGRIEANELSGKTIVDMEGAGSIGILEASGDLDLRGTVDGEFAIDSGLLNSSNMDVDGIGRIRVRNILRHVSLDKKGSGRVDMGRVRSLKLISSGSGTIMIQEIVDSLLLGCSADDEIEVRSGAVDLLRVDNSGRADIELDITADIAQIDHSGDGIIYIDTVTTTAIKNNHGKGQINIRNEP